LGAALCLEYGDAGLTPVDAYEDVLLHEFPFCANRAQPSEPPRSAGLRLGLLVWVCFRWLSATVG
jgi:hypothetical protein